MSFSIAKCLRAWLGVLGTLSLLACGGGTGGAGTGPTQTVSGVATLEISTSARTLRTGSTDSAIVTVVAKDSANRVLPNIAVQFAADSGTLETSSRTTDANGAVTATVRVGADRANRLIAVEARSGSVVARTELQATGTTVTLTAPPSGAAGADVPVSVSVTDGNSLPVAAARVVVSVNGAAQATALVTGSNGQATTTVRPTAGGVLELGATSLGASATVARVTISSDAMSVTVSPSTLVLGGSGGQVSVNWTQNGVPVTQQIRLSTTKGILRPAGSTTGSQSIVVVPGTNVATLIDNGVVGDSVVTAAALSGAVSASVTASFASQQPGSFSIQVASNTITGSTGSAKVDAFVVDASPSRNPVQGATVSFFIVADPTGGSLDQATAVTDGAGRASVTFRPGSRPTSGTDAVVIGATVGSLGTATATLTVAGGPLFVSIGFGNTIIKPTDTEYQKVFNIRVTNSAGNAVSGAAVTVRLRPVSFRKGYLAFFTGAGTSGVWDAGLATPISLPESALPPGQFIERLGWYIECPNEDYTNDGIVDGSKDYNSSGTLEPRQVASVFFSSSDGTPLGGGAATASGTTAADGSAYISVRYSQRFSPWATYEIQVSTAVGGSEGRAQLGYLLSGAASDFTNQQIPPAGAVSPFGTRLNSSPTGSFVLPSAGATPSFTWPSMAEGCRQKD
jgi:hypothetical protein